MKEVGVVILPSFYEAIKVLPDEERLEVYDAIARYGLYREEPELSPVAKSFFVLMRPVIDAGQNRYRAAQENGKKGGRPRKNQSENQTRNQRGNQDIDTDIEKDLEKDTDTEKRRGAPKRSKWDLHSPLDD